MPEIIINQGYQRFHLMWEQIHQDQRCKRFKVYPVANPDKYLILENNEPLIREKLKLKHRRIDWRQVEGQRLRERTLEAIIQEITMPAATEPEKKVILSANKSVSWKKDRPSGPTLGERMKGK